MGSRNPPIVTDIGRALRHHAPAIAIYCRGCGRKAIVPILLAHWRYGDATFDEVRKRSRCRDPKCRRKAFDVQVVWRARR